MSIRNEANTNEDTSSLKKNNAELLDLIGKNEAGKLPGILSIVFGILGIFVLGLVFAPMALLLAVYSLYKKRILLGIVGLILSIIALFTSPTFWILIIGTNQEAIKKKNAIEIRQAIEKRKEVTLSEQQIHQNGLPKFDQIMSDWNNDINAFCKDLALYSMSDINNLTTEQKEFLFNAQEKFSGKIKEYLGTKTNDGRKISIEQLKTLLFLVKISLDTKIAKNILPESSYYIDVVNIENLHNIISSEGVGNKTSTIGKDGPNSIIIKVKEGLQLTITKKDGEYYVK